MKKTLTLLLLTLSLGVGAQIQKGSSFIGLDLTTTGGFAKLTGLSANYDQFRLNNSVLSFGRFITSKHALGIAIQGSYNSYGYAFLSNRNYTLGGGLIHRYYQPLKGNLGLVVKNTLMAAYGRQGFGSNSGYNGTIHTGSLTSDLGLYYFITRNFSVDLSLRLVNVQYLNTFNDAGVYYSQSLPNNKDITTQVLLPDNFQISSLFFSLNYFIHPGTVTVK